MPRRSPDLMSKTVSRSALAAASGARSVRACAASRAGSPTSRDSNSLTAAVLRALLAAAVDARRDAWELDIDPTVLLQLRRLIELVGVAESLWPATDVAAS